MKEIILIQPKAGAFDMLGARLPSGILSIAAIPYQRGYNIKIIDQRTNPNWKNSLINSLKKEPLCVGITCMTGNQIFYALEASRIVKKYSDAPVIWGGVHATLSPKQTISNPNIDIIVLKEGELTFMEIIENLEKNKSFEDIEGIYYKKDNKIIKNPERAFIKNLNELPELPYKLVDLKNYTSLNIKGKSIDFVSSRGCPYKCAFCYNNYFNNRKWRAFSAEETVRRLKNLVEEHKIKTVYFQDDNFCVDLKRLKKILQGIIKEKLDINWGTLGLRVDSAKRMDNELLQLMQKSGCVNVDIGAESGSKRILGLIDKEIKVEDLLSVNRKLAKFPFFIKYTFIIGFPTETEKETLSTINISLRLTKENKNASTPHFIYTPFPGTPMYNFAIKNGFKPPKNLLEWSKFTFDDWYFNFPSWLSSHQIRKLKSISFTSLFANNSLRYKINKKTTKLLFDLYHPIAKFRFKNNFHHFPIDSLISRRILFDNL